MEYISVSDAAMKFKLSPRRVQVLCEQGRIDGASMISGVWLIPRDAVKPEDRRRKIEHPADQLSFFDDVRHGEVTFSEVCKMLSISEATGRNWIRLDKLIPNADGVTFDRAYINTLVSNIRAGDMTALKSRRNKKKISGIATYDNYIQSTENIPVVRSIVEAIDTTLSEPQVRIILANFAIQLVLQKIGKPISQCNLFADFHSGKLDIGIYSQLIRDLYSDHAEDIKQSDVLDIQLSDILNKKVVYIPGEDTLGFIYISLRDLANRKSAGVYYTPYNSVQALVGALVEQVVIDGQKIFDPCCGTGNFLIYASSFITDPQLLFGQDIDQLSVQITRINIALACEIDSIEFLYENFVCDDTLKSTPVDQFDIIIGNPPWGYDFADYDITYLLSTYKTAMKKGMESYDLFTERAISLLSEKGYLAFVLPEAILNVKSHKQIRGIMLDTCSFKFVSYIGNAFSGVQCPAIVMGLQLHAPGKTFGCRVTSGDQQFVIQDNRRLTDEIFSFNITDQQQICIDAIQDRVDKAYLANHAQFALGIVTGDNQQHIIEALEDRVPEDGYEIILKGSNIQKYRITPSNHYIKYTPEQFQQVAPTELYRASEKLLYRFICSTTVFAYDDRQTLSLNSCNILIPQIPNMHIKYVLAILNSRVAAYFTRMKFNSVKLLRAHIEQIPIPIVSEEIQMEIIKKVDRILKCDTSIRDLYDELDRQIMDLYNLSDNERDVIYKTMVGQNEFIL